MSNGKSNGQYEVLSPWAEADPILSKGISPRLKDLTGKKIGLFCNSKRASKPIMTVVAEKLKEMYPTSKISRYEAEESFLIVQTEGKNKAKFREWVEKLDAAIVAVGD
jgi:hypothetical protein